MEVPVLHMVTPILNSTYYQLRPLDHAPFTLAVFVTTHPQVGRLIRDILV